MIESVSGCEKFFLVFNVVKVVGLDYFGVNVVLEILIYDILN